MPASLAKCVAKKKRLNASISTLILVISCGEFSVVFRLESDLSTPKISALARDRAHGLVPRDVRDILKFRFGGCLGAHVFGLLRNT